MILLEDMTDEERTKLARLHRAGLHGEEPCRFCPSCVGRAYTLKGYINSERSDADRARDK
jgi:hypothetical protein